MNEPAATARRIIDANSYLTVATAAVAVTPSMTDAV